MPDPDAASRLVWALRRAFLVVEQRKDELLRDLPVSTAQYAVLINVAGRPGLTAADLARRLQVSPQNVAVLTAGLAERGLLERRSHPQHAHVRELHLSAAGSDLLEEADAVVSVLEQRLREHLGATASDDLRDLLERVTTLPSDAPGPRRSSQDG